MAATPSLLVKAITTPMAKSSGRAPNTASPAAFMMVNRFRINGESIWYTPCSMPANRPPPIPSNRPAAGKTATGIMSARPSFCRTPKARLPKLCRAPRSEVSLLR